MLGALPYKPTILAMSCVVLRRSIIERSACYTEERFGKVWSYTLAVASVAELKRENRHPGIAASYRHRSRREGGELADGK